MVGLSKSGAPKGASSEKLFSRVGLRARMLIILFLAGIPGVFVAVYLTVQKFKEETRQIETSVARLASLGAAQHETILANAKTLLKALVESKEQITGSSCQARLKQWEEKPSAFVSLTLFDPEGNVLCTDAASELPYVVGDDAWFKGARDDQRFSLSDYTIAKSGTPLLIAADAVVSQEKQTTAIAVLAISLEWLDFIASDVDLPPEGTITAIGPEGRILTHRGETLSDDTSPPPSDKALQRILASDEGTLRAEDRSDESRVYGYSKTKSGNVVVVVGLPRFVEYSEWGNALLNTLLAPIAILVLALGAAAWASETLVVRHVRSLIATTGEITEGNLTARSDVDYDEHELGELAAAIDTMAESLEQKMTETHLVAREMQHRIANSLSLAQSIAVQTSRHSSSTEEFNRAFTARLQALSASNRLLSEGRWSSAELSELLESILRPHSSIEQQNISLQGPEIRLEPRAAVALALSVHELATNAAKYGSLSQPGGRLSLRWAFEEQNQERLVSLRWREDGGPRPRANTHSGFGTKLLRMMIEGQLNGKLVQDYSAHGLVCIIFFPWRRPPEPIGTNAEELHNGLRNDQP